MRVPTRHTAVSCFGSSRRVFSDIQINSAQGNAVIKARWIIGAVAVGLIAGHLGPLLLTHSEQDACSFGAAAQRLTNR
jgi:hypothetical protein